MKFLHLLHQRDALLRQARLANLAYAYQRLGDFSARLIRARLHGPARLSLADPAADRLLPELTALAGHQSVIEEHFTDEDLVELADLVTFLREDAHTTEFTFHLEDFAARFLAPVRDELARAGIAVDNEAAAPAPSPEDSSRGAA
eukprot:gene50664-biopygen35671